MSIQVINSKLINQNHYKILTIVISCLLLWFAIFHEAIISAAKVWWVSEIYSHGFFILPISLYLMYRKRDTLMSLSPLPSYWPLPLLIILSLIYIVGYAGDIRLFQHAAVFSILPVTLWMVFGDKMAKVVLFPLVFILFSIPFGEEFIPTLQQVTADSSVWMLKAIGIPIFRNGLYIEIPNGRFVVAEACSGVRFFVGAVVFGAIFSYISYRSKIKQFLFFGVALIVPIIANSIRVSAIVLIGYFSDMKYATGTDHLVYGWVFFAIVIMILIVIGSRWSDDENESENQTTKNINTNQWTLQTILVPISTTIIVYLGLYGWSEYITRSKYNYLKIVESTYNTNVVKLDEDWSPMFIGASTIEHTKYNDQFERKIDYYSAYYRYNTSKSELISSHNRIYDPDNWTLKQATPLLLPNTPSDINAQMYYLAGANGSYRLVVFWYEVGDKYTYKKVFVKLYQSVEILFGNPGSGRVVIYSIKYQDEKYSRIRDDFIEFLKSNSVT